MRMQRNYYEVLGLTRKASKKDIKEKYYALARQYHPDRAKDKDIADRLFVQINKAYSTLYNDDKRAKYDASLDATTQFQMRQAAPDVPSQRPSAPAQRPGVPVQTLAQQVRGWFDQASRLQTSGEIDQAIQLCAKAIEADPVNFPGLLLMGDLFAQTGKHQEALEMYERAAKIQPSNRLLAEKMARLKTLIERRKTNPGLARPTAPSSPPPAAQRAPAPQPQPRSLFDRLINKK